ncbi:hypothetical protein PENSPDRAFT_251450 [Peniophora sp. CONT]|nr:hypothetical protein PENSPDRAFT_251450 [Peniophora sp. CONT]
MGYIDCLRRGYTELSSPLNIIMAQRQPPSYDATKPSDEPPAYQPPTTFLIGTHKLDSSLVQIKDLKLHLALLHAFAELRTQVENQTGDAAAYFPQEAQQLSPERRWTWFVHLAVERFERWTRHLPRTPLKGADSLWDERNAPPLDVWLVWHAYLLNPRCYAEDTQRVPDLACLGDLHAQSAGIFFSALEQLGDPAALTTGASPERRETWRRHTGLPFDPIECTSVLKSQSVECPKCGRVSGAPYITAEGTGFAQQHFLIVCKQDGFTIDREGLAVARFSRDLASDHLPAEKLEDPSRFLANSLRTPTKDLDYRRAKLIKDVFLSAIPAINEIVKKATGADAGLAYAIVRELGWQWQRLQGTAVYKTRTRLMSRVLMAYNDQRPFSVELVGAVLRQGSFVTKMSDLGWTAPGCFDAIEDERALHHASARYHAFLDLMASSPDAFFVPTLDIDLAWHTHQLSGAKYNSDCLKLIGRFVDHDDKVEEVHLADAFDVTCRAWNARFGVQYMHCGCPLPGATVGQRLSRLIQRATRHAHSGSALRSSEDAATHPSDHNGIYVPGATTDAALAEHTAKLVKRRERDLKLVQKGKMAREDYDRGGMHGAAFLYPVPIWYAAAGCAVGAGGVGTWGYAGCLHWRGFLVRRRWGRLRR